MYNEVYLIPAGYSSTFSDNIEWLRLVENNACIPMSVMQDCYIEAMGYLALQHYRDVTFLAFYDNLTQKYFVIKDSYGGELYWRTQKSVSNSLRAILSPLNKEDE